MKHRDGMFDDFLPRIIGIDAADQRHVEFDDIRLEVGQQAKAGMAGSEIVDRCAEAALA